MKRVWQRHARSYNAGWNAAMEFMRAESLGQRGHVPPEANAPEQSMPLGAGVEPTDGDPAN